MSGTDDEEDLPTRPGADLEAATLSNGQLVIANPASATEPEIDAWLMGDPTDVER